MKISVTNNNLLEHHLDRSEGVVLTGYVVPGCEEAGAWMLWGKSSVISVVAAVLAQS